MSGSPYDAFDCIVVITLRERVDRQTHVINLFKKLNIPFEFYYAERHPRGGLVGCFTSHVNVYKIALKKGYKNALIFEDDMIPTPGYDPKIIAHIGSFIKTQPNWEMVQLGYGLRVSHKNSIEITMTGPLYIYNNYSQTHPIVDGVSLLLASRATNHLVNYCGLLLHAYCVSESAMHKIISLSPFALSKTNVQHYDMWLLTVLQKSNCYAATPMLFDQQWCFETSNVAVNIFEKISKPTHCAVQDLQLHYLWSLIAFYRERILIATGVVCTIVLYMLFSPKSIYNYKK